MTLNCQFVTGVTAVCTQTCLCTLSRSGNFLNYLKIIAGKITHPSGSSSVVLSFNFLFKLDIFRNLVNISACDLLL
jgi:hypothetical protein